MNLKTLVGWEYFSAEFEFTRKGTAIFNRDLVIEISWDNAAVAVAITNRGSFRFNRSQAQSILSL